MQLAQSLSLGQSSARPHHTHHLHVEKTQGCIKSTTQVVQATNKKLISFRHRNKLSQQCSLVPVGFSERKQQMINVVLICSRHVKQIVVSSRTLRGL